MKFIRYIMCFVVIFSSCFKREEIPPASYYQLILDFAQKIKPETGLVLRSYGVNNHLPEDYQKMGVASFGASFKLLKTKNDEISLDYARNLIVFLGERFLQEINSNQEVRPVLDFYPFTSNSINISVYFVDERDAELGQGVALIYFWRGKILYEGFKIKEYATKYGTWGEHFTIHEETYAEALEIVKRQKGI